MKLKRGNKIEVSFPTKMNFGCGYDKLAGYLNVDVDSKCEPDLLVMPGDFSKLPLGYFKELVAYDVLEHIPRNLTLQVFFQLIRTCADGATVKLQTTSLEKLLVLLTENPSFSSQYGWATCLFGNQAHPGDFHFTGFTESILETFCRSVGLEIKNKVVKDGWMFSWECAKIQNWEYLLKIEEFPKFLSDCYEAAFGRKVDETGMTHFTNSFNIGVTQEEIFLDIFSRPERLFYIAESIS